MALSWIYDALKFSYLTVKRVRPAHDEFNGVNASHRRTGVLTAVHHQHRPASTEAASTDEAVAGQRRSQKTRLTPASAARKFPGNEPAADAILLERRSVKTKVLFLEQAFWVNRQPTAAAGAGAVPAEAGKMSLGTITYRH